MNSSTDVSVAIDAPQHDPSARAEEAPSKDLVMIPADPHFEHDRRLPTHTTQVAAAKGAIGGALDGKGGGKGARFQGKCNDVRNVEAAVAAATEALAAL
mgnify:CR=1 FL=1